MNRNWKVACTAVALAVSASLQAAVLPEHQTNSAWFTDAQTKLTTKLQTNNQFKAKNVILFVGDGMGISTLTSARIHKGQLAGNPGEEGYLTLPNWMGCQTFFDKSYPREVRQIR